MEYLLDSEVFLLGNRLISLKFKRNRKSSFSFLPPPPSPLTQTNQKQNKTSKQSTNTFPSRLHMHIRSVFDLTLRVWCCIHITHISHHVRVYEWTNIYLRKVGIFSQRISQFFTLSSLWMELVEGILCMFPTIKIDFKCTNLLWLSFPFSVCQNEFFDLIQILHFLYLFISFTHTWRLHITIEALHKMMSATACYFVYIYRLNGTACSHTHRKQSIHTLRTRRW